MKSKLPFLVIIVTLCVILPACRKNGMINTPPVVKPYDPYAVPPQPSFRLTQFLTRFTNGFVALKSFHYDSLYRLIGLKDETLNYMEYVIQYEGDRMKFITFYDQLGNQIARHEDPLRFSENGDTLTFRYLDSLGSRRDTTTEVFVFENERLREYKIVTTSSNPQLNYVSRDVYNYGADGNLVNCMFVDNANNQQRWKVNATDTRKNPARYLSPIYLAFTNADRLSGGGENNATEVDFGNGDVRSFEYTYDADGYPLTKKLRNENFIRYEYKYEH